MYTVYDYFITERDRSIEDFSNYSETWNKIQELEEKFKTINFIEKNVFKQEPKYYLQNKRKKGTADIQDGLRKRIEHLNDTYENYTYFLTIDKSILNKEENKHVYNIYQVSILEFKKINLLYDIIQESDNYFFPNHFHPFRFSNLNDEYRLKLYEMIDDTINFCEIFTNTETVENIEIKNYNKYLYYLKKTILEFFMDVYSKNNEKINELYSQLKILDPYCHINESIPLLTTLELYYKNDKYKNTVEKIVDIIIELDWDITMSLIKYDSIEKCYEIVIENEEKDANNYENCNLEKEDD